jgi:erythromycin esterase
VGAGLRINDYVRHGTGDIRQIMREEFQSGTRLWHTQEYLDLFEWMRDHNRHHPHNVEYAGNDIDYPANELFARVLAYAHARQPDLAAGLASLYQGLRPTTDMNTWMSTYPNRPLADRQILATRARQALDRLRQCGPGRDATAFHRAVHYARTIWQVATLWRYDLTVLDEIKAALRHRELAMAENTIWAHRIGGTKVLLSAHNLHVAYESIEPDFRPEMQGTFLRQALGHRYVSAGFTFHHGSFNAGPDNEPLSRFTVPPPPADHNEYTLDLVRHPDFVIDTRHLPATARSWLTQPRPTRTIGAAYPVPTPAIALGRSHDLVIHLHRVRAAQLLDP